MARTAIFDLDGTLVNTLYDLAASSNQVLMRLGLPTHEVDAYRFFVGEGVGHLCRRAVGSSASAAILALHERLYRAQFSRYGHPLARPYDGIERLLEALAERGVQMAVLTNKPQQPAEALLKRLGLSCFFTKIVGVVPNRAKKPDPRALTELCEAMGIGPSQVVFFGDTNVDMMTAVGAGAYALGVSWGFRAEDELRAAGAARIIAHPLDALKLFDE